MNRKSKPRILKASLVVLASLFLGSWLWAQKEPAPPAPTTPAAAPAATPSQTEEMLRALRRAMTNAPRTTNPAASPTNTTLSTTTNRPPSLSAPAPGFPAASPSTASPVPTNRATVSPGSPATPTASTASSAPTNTTVIAPVVIGAPAAVPTSPGPGAPAPATSAATAASGGLQPVPSRTPSVIPAPPGTVLPQPGGVPAAQPAFPSLPGQAPIAPAQAAPAPALAPAADELLPPTVIQAQGMALDQFFELYSMISGRTVLRPYELTGAAKGITLKAQTDWTREEAIFAMDSALALNGIAMIPVSEKFVKAVLAQSAPTEGSELVKVEPAPGSQAEQFITQIVELKVVKPSEIAQLLATFSKIPNSITPFDNNNTIVLREYGSNVKRMLEVIRKVDVERESDYKLEVIPIRYGKVTDLYNTMGSLISGQPSSGGGSTTTQRTGGTRGGLSRGGSGGGGLRGGINQRNQSGLVNPMQQQQAQPVSAGGAQSSFQNRLQQIVSRAAGGAEVELLQEARIVPDERSNTLLIFANKRDIEMITNIVAKVDVLLAQVLIEAIILEVKLNDSQNVGVSMLQQPKRFGNDLSGVGGVNNGQQFLSGITNLAGSMPSGFSYFGKIGDDMDFAVTALARDSNVKVTSRPRVQTSHGIPGDFIITEQVPYVSALNDYGGFGGFGGSSALTRSQVEYLDIGVELYVTPYITPDGYVVMDINQTFSQRGPDVIIDGNPFPSLNNRETTSTLTVRDGDTIMMGGFITDSKNRAKSGVPFLKDVPLLGALFRSKSSSTDRTELIVLMRATVLENPRQAALVADKERQQLPGIQAAEQEFKAIEEKHRRKGERSRRK